MSNRAKNVAPVRMNSVVNIDFEWLRFSDYQLEMNESQSPLGRPRIPTAADLGSPSIYVRGVGAPLKVRSLEAFPDLYLRLKEYDLSRESHIEFARKYGLLSDTKKESSYQWETKLTDLKELIELIQIEAKWAKRKGVYVKRELPYSYNLEFYPSINGEIKFAIVPRSLYAAIYLQCISSRAAGVEVRTCRACGKAFQIGGDTGHRSNRRFCSDQCRFEFNHRHRRGKR